jgi:hypothetical protein
VAGICVEGTCEDAMLCEGVDCSDGDACTEDVCDRADGECSNPDVDCSDDNECTEDVCNPADGECSWPDEPHPTECEFSSGVGGICMEGTCVDAMLCEGVDCSDDNDCTKDVCDRADGECSFPNKTDGIACEFSSGMAGICMSGTCEDAKLCEDVDCSDDDACTEDVCNPADGECSNPDDDCSDGNQCTEDVCDPDAVLVCSNPNLEHPTECEFSSGVAGVCDGEGTCLDAMLCEEVVCSDDDMCTEDVCDRADGLCSFPAVDCSDGNQCTEDVCHPADGLCSNPNVPHPTACDFSSGVAGVCDGAGTCLDLKLCEEVVCSDDNECTEDVCDRADGLCSFPNEMVDTVCDQDGGTVCDGDGNCVECNADRVCDSGEICVDNECVCSDDEGCDAGEEICVENECVSDDANVLCDVGLCAVSETLRQECVVEITACLLLVDIQREECILVALLTCNPE